jgi:hypothetical protein
MNTYLQNKSALTAGAVFLAVVIIYSILTPDQPYAGQKISDVYEQSPAASEAMTWSENR